MEPAKACWSQDLGKLLLRLAVGGLMLFHGIAKLKGISGVSDLLKANGLPDWLAYGVYAGELLAPVLVLIGFWTRPAAFVIAIDMGFALWLMHRNDFMKLNEFGGWAVELEMFYLVGALALCFLGAGRIGVSGIIKRGMAEETPKPAAAPVR
jgi:putative oxidoreductase